MGESSPIQRIGKYELLEKLGEGGFGVVYKARDPALNVLRAIKVLHPILLADSRFIARFQKEARIAAQLEHPHLVPVYELGEEKGRYYLVMKYLAGGSLKDRLSREGKLSFAQACQILEQVAGALAFAFEEQQLVHRDLKPGNILFDGEGKALVADFGFARSLAETSASYSSGGFVGTPAYMAPEVWRGKPASPASDVYSLACVFYEMVTGQVLFAGESPPEVMTKHVLEGPQFAVGWAEGLPEGVEAVLLKALAKEPSERYATAGEFVQALQGVGKAEAMEERKEARPEAQVLLETGKRLEEQGELQAALTVYRQAQKLAADQPALLTEVNARVQDLEQRAASATQAESLRPALERTAPFVTPLSLGEGKGVRAEPRRRTWLWVGLGGLLVLAVCLALGVGLLFLGMRGDGPLAALATETPIPMVTPTPIKIFHAMESTDAYGVAMRLVPAGEFSMGSDADDALAECQKFRSDCKRDWFTDEEPVHTVYLDAFYMDKYEVTNAQYAACVEAGECTLPHEDSSYTRSRYYGKAAFDNYPVIKVDWDQAKTYCEWRGARLPTEAEWEKAARGADGRVYPWGNSAPTCSLANFDRFGGSYCVGDTSAVGSYPEGVSPYGIYDLAGNVSEWVADWYDKNYYASSPYRNPAGPATGTSRALRGGSWYANESDLRASSRSGLVPALWLNFIGFRCSPSP